MVNSLMAALVATLFATSLSFAQSGLPPKPPKPPVPPPVSTLPEVEAEPLSVGATCVDNNGEEAEILHFAKILFTVERGNLVPRDNRDGFELNRRIPRGIPLTVILRHDPEKVHHILARVLAFLRLRSDDPGNRGRLEILSAEYSTECGTPDDEPTPPPPPHPYPPKK